MADIAPGSAGQMFGLCGTFASLAGIIATSSVGYIVESTGAGSYSSSASVYSIFAYLSSCVAQPLHMLP